MKNIWIFNQYNMPPEFGPLNRHYNFGKYLKRKGLNPVIFVGSYLHNTDIQVIKGKELYKKYNDCDFPYLFVRTCNYSKSKTKRIYAMFEFYRNIMKITKKMEKPDVIIGSTAHPLAAIAAIRLAKKYGCQSIVEVRDLWPESFVAYNILKRDNPFLRLLYAGEKWIYKNADKLIFTMEGGKDYLLDRGWDKDQGGPIDLSKVYHINNGVDLEVFNINKERYKVEDDDLNDTESFKVVYTGSIGRANNVKKIVEAAEHIYRNGNTKIKFLIFGRGSEQKSLERYCRENNLENIKFKGFIDKKYIPYILSKSDLNILHFEQNSLKKYGASLNKLFDYFASGKPTISDSEFGYDIIKKYECGIVVDNADAEQLANSILEISEMPVEKYTLYCNNSLKAAQEYDFKVLAQKLIDIL